MTVTLDDTAFAHLYIPPGMLHGFQALTEQTDVCYRIDREHVPGDDLSVRYDDPTLAIGWPLAVEAISQRDLAAGSWTDLVAALGTPEAGPRRESVIRAPSSA